MSTLEFADVLVPTDGSETADAALGTALSLSSHLGARVHVLSVVNPYVLSKTTDLEARRKEAEEAVEGAADRTRVAGVPVETAVREGAPHEAIEEYVTDRGVDVVVMGTHGRTGVGRALMGSVTEKTVRTAGVPVLTVHENEPGFEPSRALLATDGSEPAGAAERVGLALAGEFGATVEAVSVVDTATLTAGSDPVGQGIRALQDVREALTEGAEDAVATVEADGEANGVAVETTVGEGRPHERILATAGERGADVIVIGTHGRGGLERFVLGSVAEKVLRLADRPVLVVPSDGADSGA